MIEINLIPRWLRKIIFEKKLRSPTLIRKSISLIFAISFFVLLIIAIGCFNSKKKNT